ncbi:MAG: PqiC family protein [Burkholderiales bacterium]
MKYGTNSCMLAALLMLLAACASAPKERFYTLTDGVGSAGATLPSQDYAVVVGPVFVPDVVDRPQFVLRMVGSEVKIADQARWAEPLRQAIGRVVAVNIAHGLNNARVSSQAQGSTGEADFRVVIDVQRFDSAPGVTATIEVTWTVRRIMSGEQETARVRIEEPVSGPDYEALVAAHARAIARVSDGIVTAIRASRQRGVAAAPAH